MSSASADVSPQGLTGNHFNEQTRRAKGIAAASFIPRNASISPASRRHKAQAQGKESKEETMITRAEIVAALTRFGPVTSFIVGALVGFVIGAIVL